MTLMPSLVGGLMSDARRRPDNHPDRADEDTVFEDLLCWMEEIETLTKTIRQRIDEAKDNSDDGT